MRSSMHKNIDKISVIMTTFNSQNVVERAINSILNQTYQNIEFLILDDNSEDNTHNVLKKYENEKIIKIYKNSKNLGLTKSLNFLIKKSEGTYIARQDDDDTSFINRLEKQIQTLKKFNLDFCTARAKTIQSNKFRPGLSAYIPKNILINFKNPFVHGTLFIKKNTLEKIGLYNEDFYYSQDYKLIYDLIKKGYKYKYINEVLYNLNTINNISELKKTEQKYYADCVKKNIKPKKLNENLY